MKRFRFPTLRGSFFPALLVALLLPALAAAETAAPATIPEPAAADAAVARGETIFRSSCQACHSLKYSGYQAKMAAADAKKAFGKAPPDLNLMTKARGGGDKGAAHIVALLTGYNDTPEKNSVFPNIAMPPAFSGNDPQLLRKARDVAAFLDAAADPFSGQRSRLGKVVLGYMVVLGALLYALNRRTWKDVRKRTSAK